MGFVWLDSQSVGRRDRDGALRIHPADAAALGIDDGDPVRVTTRAGSALGSAALDPAMSRGQVALPNGLGVDFPDGDGCAVVTGVAPNELTSFDDRDPIAGTPHHKHVRARLQRVGLSA